VERFEKPAVLRGDLGFLRLAASEADGCVKFQHNVEACCANAGDGLGDSLRVRNTVVDGVPEISKQLLHAVIKLQGRYLLRRAFRTPILGCRQPRNKPMMQGRNRGGNLYGRPVRSTGLTQRTQSCTEGAEKFRPRLPAVSFVALCGLFVKELCFAELREKYFSRVLETTAGRAGRRCTTISSWLQVCFRRWRNRLAWHFGRCGAWRGRCFTKRRERFSFCLRLTGRLLRGGSGKAVPWFGWSALRSFMQWWWRFSDSYLSAGLGGFDSFKAFIHHAKWLTSPKSVPT